MKNRVKFFAFLLAACLVFSMFAGVAYATEGEPDQTVTPGAPDADGGDDQTPAPDPDNGNGSSVNGGSGNITGGGSGDDGSVQPLAVLRYLDFDANGGSGTMEKIEDFQSTASNPSTFTLPQCTFTPPEGKEFKCWEVDGVSYNPGDTVTINAPYTAYAQWKDIDNGQGGDPDDGGNPDDGTTPPTLYYGISFNENGGSGSMANVNVVQGESTNLPACGFTAPDGKQFDSWNTQMDGNGTSYAANASFTPIEDTVLYAIWKDVAPLDPDDGNDDETTHTCQWTYKASGNSIIATCIADSVSSNNTNANAPACPYGGEVEVSLKGQSGLVALINAEEFNKATGQSVSSGDIKYYDADGQEYTTAPTAKGTYTAKLTVENVTAELEYKITASGSSGSTASRYTITYVANGGCGCPCYYDRVKAGSSTRIMCNPFSAKGLIFIGWSTRSSGCGGTWYEPGECIRPTRNMTLYARWIAEDDAVVSSTGHNNQHYGWSYTCGPNGIILVSPKTGDASVISYAAMAVAAAAGIVIKRRSK